MKVNLELEMGNTTCAAAPGKFCPFVRIRSFGKIWECTLFSYLDGVNVRLLENRDGWLKRCEECLEKWPPEETNK